MSEKSVMLDFALNILGSEWIIIILVALFALFGTNKLPDVAKKLGRTVGEFNRSKSEIQNQISGIANLNITNPVQNERQKLEFMAKSLGIDFASKTDDEIRKAISEKMPEKSTESDQKDKK